MSFQSSVATGVVAILSLASVGGAQVLTQRDVSLRMAAAFGAASLALLRFTGGVGWAILLASVSLLAWVVVPLSIAAARLAKADL